MHGEPRGLFWMMAAAAVMMTVVVGCAGSGGTVYRISDREVARLARQPLNMRGCRVEVALARGPDNGPSSAPAPVEPSPAHTEAKPPGGSTTEEETAAPRQPERMPQSTPTPAPEPAPERPPALAPPGEPGAAAPDASIVVSHMLPRFAGERWGTRPAAPVRGTPGGGGGARPVPPAGGGGGGGHGQTRSRSAGSSLGPALGGAAAVIDVMGAVADLVQIFASASASAGAGERAAAAQQPFRGYPFEGWIQVDAAHPLHLVYLDGPKATVRLWRLGDEHLVGLRYAYVRSADGPVLHLPPPSPSSICGR